MQAFWDFFVWWGDELKGLFTGRDAGHTLERSIRMTAGHGQVSGVRIEPDGTEDPVFDASGDQNAMLASPALDRVLKRIDRVDFAVDRTLAQVKTFKLPRTLVPEEVDAFKRGLGDLMPEDEAKGPLRLAVRIAPQKDGGTRLHVGFIPNRVIAPWATRVAESKVDYRFAGVMDGGELIPALSSPAARAGHLMTLPARPEDVQTAAPSPRYGPLLVLGLLVSAAVLALGFHQNREQQIARLQERAQQTDGISDQAFALDQQISALKENRRVLAARMSAPPPGDVLDMVAVRLPAASAVTRIMVTPERLRVAGETRRAEGLEQTFAEDPLVRSVTVALRDERTPVGGTPFDLEIDLAGLQSVAPEAGVSP